MQEPELRKEPSLLLDGMEMHINRRELEREWEQIDALLPPCFPPDCWQGEEGEQILPDPWEEEWMSPKEEPTMLRATAGL